METKTNATECHILAAAEHLFTERGFNAVSTTDIAREAGCNQALVHYYFRTKENLFQTVFVAKLNGLLARLQAPIADEDDIFAIVRHIVDTYFDILADCPQLPVFFLNELVLNRERALLMRDTLERNLLRHDFFVRFSAALRRAAERGEVRRVEPLDYYLDIISLVVFSHIAQPMLVQPDVGDTSSDYLDRRRREVCTLLSEGLKISPSAQ
ncbi:MAG: TetR/AcrR family transcriptional regulator [Bacteroidales bacterium]|nr:TetR/AcrR family transcriptional regulator [Bacteroidales bacterium]